MHLLRASVLALVALTFASAPPSRPSHRDGEIAVRPIQATCPTCRPPLVPGAIG